jgi:hypothetical protein
MKFTVSDLLILKLPLLALVIAVAVGGAIATTTNRHDDELNRIYAATTSDLSAARARYNTAHQHSENVAGYEEMYQAITTRGLFGEERRLDWIERLDTVRRRHKLFSADYSISAQRPFQPRLKLDGPPISASASTVEIRISALHEGHVFDFLNDLKQNAPGVLLLDNCALRRSNSNAVEPAGPNVNADCSFEWITVKVPGR